MKRKTFKLVNGDTNIYLEIEAARKNTKFDDHDVSFEFINGEERYNIAITISPEKLKTFSEMIKEALEYMENE